MWSSHFTPSSTSFQLLPFACNLFIKGVNVFWELSRKSAYSDKGARELAAFFALSASICTILMRPFKYFHSLSFILHFSWTSGPVSYQQKMQLIVNQAISFWSIEFCNSPLINAHFFKRLKILFTLWFYWYFEARNVHILLFRRLIHALITKLDRISLSYFFFNTTQVIFWECVWFSFSHKNCHFVRPFIEIHYYYYYWRVMQSIWTLCIYFISFLSAFVSFFSAYFRHRLYNSAYFRN